jgi:hypothetical protein
MPRVMPWGLMLTCRGSKSPLWRSGVCSTGSHSATAQSRYRCGLWMYVLTWCSCSCLCYVPWLPSSHSQVCSRSCIFVHAGGSMADPCVAPSSSTVKSSTVLLDGATHG